VWAKAAGANWIWIHFFYFGEHHGAFFNLSGDGALGNTTGTIVAGSNTITKYPNGWFRLTISHTATYTIFYTGQCPATSNGTGYSSILGQSPNGVLLYGAQTEVGTGASSYIPTGASGVTRNADSCLMSGTNFSSWYSQGRGTVVWTGSAFRITAGHLANINTVNNDPRITAYIGASALTNLVTNGTTQASFFFGTVTANTAFKAAWRFNTNDFAAVLNNGTVYTDTSGTVPTGVDRMQIGAAEGGYQFLDGWVKSIKYYPTALDDSALKATTI
jgi:hypothetical protein